MGNLAAVNDAIFLPRGGSEEQRAKALDVISERQNQIEKSKKYHPLLIFAEGCTTNGSSLIKFKKGAFSNLKRVTPMVMSYSLDSSVSVAFDIMEILPLSILNLSWGFMRCKTIKLPDIWPNEYMLNRKEAKGLERWEAYAEVIREVMSKASGLPKSNETYQQKRQYEGYMQMIPKYTSPYLLDSGANASNNNPLSALNIKGTTIIQGKKIKNNKSGQRKLEKQLSSEGYSERSTESDK